jgi:hypothetical protein
LLAQLAPAPTDQVQRPPRHSETTNTFLRGSENAGLCLLLAVLLSETALCIVRLALLLLLLLLLLLTLYTLLSLVGFKGQTEKYEEREQYFDDCNLLEHGLDACAMTGLANTIDLYCCIQDPMGHESDHRSSAYAYHVECSVRQVVLADVSIGLVHVHAACETLTAVQ